MAVFFFDNDISFRIVRALRELVDPDDHTLLALRDEFSASTKDTDWIPRAGAEGWIVVSKDDRQRRRRAEHRALQEHRVRALYIRHSGRAQELYADAARIIRNWPKIRDWGISAGPGALARLDASDRIKTV